MHTSGERRTAHLSPWSGVIPRHPSTTYLRSRDLATLGTYRSLRSAMSPEYRRITRTSSSPVSPRPRRRRESSSAPSRSACRRRWFRRSRRTWSAEAAREETAPGREPKFRNRAGAGYRCSFSQARWSAKAGRAGSHEPKVRHPRLWPPMSSKPALDALVPREDLRLRRRIIEGHDVRLQRDLVGLGRLDEERRAPAAADVVHGVEDGEAFLVLRTVVVGGAEARVGRTEGPLRMRDVASAGHERVGADPGLDPGEDAADRAAQAVADEPDPRRVDLRERPKQVDAPAEVDHVVTVSLDRGLPVERAVQRDQAGSRSPARRNPPWRRSPSRQEEAGRHRVAGGIQHRREGAFTGRG